MQKTLLQIENQINNFFATDEFKELVLKYDGKCSSYDEEALCIYNNEHIEEILNAINVKIKQYESSISIYVTRDLLFCTSSVPIYIETYLPDGEKVIEYIGSLIIYTQGFGQNNKWIIRCYDKYIYHYSNDWYRGAKLNSISDIKKMIFNDRKRKILSDCKHEIKDIDKEVCHLKKVKEKLIKRKNTVIKWKYAEDSTNGNKKI